MAKITFLGAGSAVFVRNVIGDCFCSEVLRDCEIALYDIDAGLLNQSMEIISAMQKNAGAHARLTAYLGPQQRRDALRGADFVINAVQIGGYDPCTITDFEVPKRFGLRQTIGDTAGIGGIMRALRTIPVVESFARDMEEVCPGALFLNYVNPMAMVTGYLQRYTGVNTVGLCHSVQVCSERLLKKLGMEDALIGRKELIAGINHMAWLLEIKDRDGNDLYPEIRRRAHEKNISQKHDDMVRFDYIDRLGYYCTESSEHNAEYSAFYIKSKYPELIERYQIPLDEYPRRCLRHIQDWAEERNALQASAQAPHTRSHEYASYIMEAVLTNKPVQIGGNVLNAGHLITNFPEEACVEVPCMVNNTGVHPCRVGSLPLQCAAMNLMQINVHLLTIEAAHTRRRDCIYQAAMMDPHTSSELDIDTIVKLVDALIEAHGTWLPAFH